MSYSLIASGGILDACKLGEYEGYLAEGDRALLELDLRMPVSTTTARELEDRLKQAGVEDVGVTTAGPTLRIYFRKGFPWLAVIAGIVLGMIVLAVLVVGWRLYKEVIPEALQPAGGILILALVALGVVLLVRRL